MLAGVLAALCLVFSWRAYQRCRSIHVGAAVANIADDELERRLLDQELNLELNLALRTVKALGRAALFGGTGVTLWSYATGELSVRPLPAVASFVCGLVGWGGCKELERRIGSLAESWRADANRRRRQPDAVGRIQGVDQPKGSGVA